MPACPTELQGDVQFKRVCSDAIISRNQFSGIPNVATMQSEPVLMYELSRKRLTASVHPKPVFMNQLCRGENRVGGLPRLLPGDTKLRSRCFRSDLPCKSIKRPFVVDQAAHEVGLRQYAVLPGDFVLLLATIMAEAHDRLDFPFLVAVEPSFVPEIDAELVSSDVAAHDSTMCHMYA